MGVLSITYGPYTQAGGIQTIALTSTQRNRYNHSIALKFTDSSGVSVTPSVGTMKAYGRREGGSMFEPLDSNPLDAKTTAGWPCTEDPIDSVQIEPVGLSSSLQYFVVINSLSSWS